MRGQRNLNKPGDRYGRLVVQKVWVQKRKDNSKETVAEYRCDCGNIVVVRTKYVRCGHRQSCGCLRTQEGNQHHCWKGYGKLSAAMWSHIRGSAARRSRLIPFEITIEQAWTLFEQQNGKCAISGVAISFPAKCRRYGVHDSTASLDRIDSLKGYIVGNVQWVHKTVNAIKWQLPQDEFLRWCTTITFHNQGL